MSARHRPRAWVRLGILCLTLAFVGWWAWNLWAHPSWTEREVLIWMLGGGAPA